MNDIFISYKREEQGIARKLADALESEGWTVWWGPKLRAGEHFDDVIEKALNEAKCVVVLWSQRSVQSRYVRDEATYALDQDKLIPIAIEDIKLPFRFRGVHTLRLFNWHGSKDLSDFRRLVGDIAAIVGPPLTKSQEAQPTDRQESKSVDALPSEILNSIGMEFVLIPAGEFLMGSIDRLEEERPVHKVRISRPFYLGKYAVTQAEWEAVVGNDASRFKGDLNRPVEMVSWEDVKKFIRWLEARGVERYRLPTEAEWEYACRAGSTTIYSFGNNSNQLGEHAWYEANADGQTHPVGQLKPNAWGLYDMHGNVYEWVQDWYGEYPAEAVTDPQGPSSPSSDPDRVNRGGCWQHDAWSCRSARRGRLTPDSRRDNLGFRLLRMVR